MLLIYGLIGALAGVIAKVADESSITELSDLGTSPTVWVLALALIARFAPTPTVAAVRATLFFAAMCAGYYAWASLVLHFPGSGALLAAWLVLAVTVVPLGAAALRWASDRSDAGGEAVLAGAVVAGAAAIAFTDPAIIRLWYAATGDLPPDFPLRPVQGIFAVAATAAIVLVVPTQRAVRAWALVLLIPASYVVGAILDLAGGRLIPG